MITILTDNEILSWNDRLSDLDPYFIVMPRYISSSSYNPVICFQKNARKTNWGVNIGEVLDVEEPVIKYNFIFSILSSKVDKFNEIYNIIKLNHIRTITYLNNDKTRTLNIDGLDVHLSINEHLVFEKEYQRYSYDLNGKLGDIMAFVKLLEDTILFLDCETKYKLSDIVCDKKDNSVDYIVLEFIYSIGIEYLVAEIIDNSSGNVIRYGKTMVKQEKELVWSRDARINKILENE
jgi:hypothetical protein